MNTNVKLTKQDVKQIIAEHFSRQLPGKSPQNIEVKLPDGDLTVQVEFTAFVTNVDN